MFGLYRLVNNKLPGSLYYKAVSDLKKLVAAPTTHFLQYEDGVYLLKGY